MLICAYLVSIHPSGYSTSARSAQRDNLDIHARIHLSLVRANHLTYRQCDDVVRVHALGMGNYGQSLGTRDDQLLCISSNRFVQPHRGCIR